MMKFLILILFVFFSGCVSISPSKEGLYEIRNFTKVPDEVNISKPMFAIIAGSEPNAEWVSVGEFEKGRLVVWWQERKI